MARTRQAPLWVHGLARRLSWKELRRTGAPRFPDGYRAPAYNCIRRVLQRIHAAAPEAKLDAWLEGLERKPQEPLGLDGKTLWGSLDRNLREDGKLAAMSPRQRVATVGLDTGQVYGQ